MHCLYQFIINTFSNNVTHSSRLPAYYPAILSPCNAMFSPVHFSMTVSNLSQMLIKRSLLSSRSSIQSPIHFLGTPFSMQHCSKMVCSQINFQWHNSTSMISDWQKCYLLPSFTWTKPIIAFLCHFYLALTWGSSKECFLFFEPGVYS